MRYYNLLLCDSVHQQDIWKDNQNQRSVKNKGGWGENQSCSKTWLSPKTN